MKTYILYHGNCPDGFGAALAAHIKFGDAAEYIPVSYGKPPPEMDIDSDIYILDFSYPRDVLIGLYDGPGLGSVVVLDHHATAERDLDGLPFCKFDMNKSGAVLAWEFFHPTEPAPEFFVYLQDRDLWQFKLPDSREVSMAVRSYPYDFDLWRKLMWDVNALRREGIACRRLTDQQVLNMVAHHRWAAFDLRHKAIRYYPKDTQDFCSTNNEPPEMFYAPVANASVFFSEVGEKLLELYPSAEFSAYYSDRPDGKRQWGLRSRPAFDCSVIAKAFGGGGHKQASGFVEAL